MDWMLLSITSPYFSHTLHLLWPTQPNLSLHSDLLCSHAGLLMMLKEVSQPRCVGPHPACGPQPRWAPTGRWWSSFSTCPTPSHTNTPSNLAHSLQIPFSPASSPFSAEDLHRKNGRQVVRLPQLPTHHRQSTFSLQSSSTDSEKDLPIPPLPPLSPLETNPSTNFLVPSGSLLPGSLGYHTLLTIFFA